VTASSRNEREPVVVTSMRVVRERVTARLVDAAYTTTKELVDGPGQGRAAVAIVVREATDGPQVLLIRRADHPGDAWSGHMAFPGGRENPQDENLLATAIRETLEEVGLDLGQAGRLLGQLAPLPAVARGRLVGMTIVPFIFELVADAELLYSEEVAEAVWVPLDPLLQGQLRTTFAVDRDGGERMELPAHDVGGRIVWGLTYRMLDSLFELLR
jgi:8-oxo-dGTP pyrophosphatase MutT (NUDIX family)